MSRCSFRTAIVVVVAALPAILGCSASSASPTDPGRSMVGLARRPDGSVVMVTAWCIGERTEHVRISRFDGPANETVYTAEGFSTGPVTVHTIGRMDTLTPSRNGELADGTLVAYNSGKRRDGLRTKEYPSTAVVFRVSDLPTSAEDLPTALVAGNRASTSLRTLIDAKCTAPTHITGG